MEGGERHPASKNLSAPDSPPAKGEILAESFPVLLHRRSYNDFSNDWQKIVKRGSIEKPHLQKGRVDVFAILIKSSHFEIARKINFAGTAVLRSEAKDQVGVWHCVDNYEFH
ncbi:hypothetical protein CEXT_365551 [Caerostris extrusa]|uniref:Uncharacterized protein n=1 Tax=Caerostris extrusa TaxID=172846 RepID=A0AAV4UXS0_CAEEX|nr:hypothetical protein CEXT_365551 [Caerostris extrusa]